MKNAQFLLKSQESVQESWKCKILLQIQKSAEKVPSTIGKCLLLGTNIQNTCGGIKIPKYRASNFEPGLQSRRILEMSFMGENKGK